VVWGVVHVVVCVCGIDQPAYEGLGLVVSGTVQPLRTPTHPPTHLGPLQADAADPGGELEGARRLLARVVEGAHRHHHQRARTPAQAVLWMVVKGQCVRAMDGFGGDVCGAHTQRDR
jgi:hypothetical protein